MDSMSSCNVFQDNFDVYSDGRKQLREVDLPRVQMFKQGEKHKPTFSLAEMQRRFDALRKIMTEENLDAVYLSSHHSLIYFGDFVYIGIGRMYAILVTHNDVTVLAASVDGGFIHRRTQIGRALSVTDWHKDGHFITVAESLQESLKDRSIHQLGLEFDHVTVQRYNLLQKYLPNTTLVDVGDQLQYMRLIKSDEEIALLKRIANISAKVMGKILQEIKIGMTEAQLFAFGQHELHKEVAYYFPDSVVMDSFCWVQSGINTDGAHNCATTKKLKWGDILSINVFPMVAGYYAPIERVAFVGEIPTEAHRRVWTDNLELHKKGLSFIKAGVKCSEVARQMNKLYQEKDLFQYRTIGFGHSCGVMSTYYGREAGGELRECNETVLQPGMVITMEPMLTIPQGEPGEGCYRDHDIFIVKEDGIEVIPDFPIGPDHLVIKV